jgi:hypothetical protein
MQQNNQDMTGFQNSLRKNSWQKPKSLYEAKASMDLEKIAQSAYNSMKEQEPGFFSGTQAFTHSDKGDVFERGVSNNLVNRGRDRVVVNPKMIVQVHGDESDANALRGMSETEMESLGDELVGHLEKHHRNETDIERGTPDEDIMDMYTDALQKQAKFLPKAP